jgi:transposase
MGKSKTPSFITEMAASTSPAQEKTLLKRLEAARKVYNACLGQALRRLDQMRASDQYQAARAMPRGKPKSKERKARNRAFREARRKFAFDEFPLHDYAAQFNHCWLGDHLDINTIQKIASRAFDAVNQHCLGKRGRPRFKGPNQFDSVEGKDNASGIRWRDDRVEWLGLELKALIPADDLVIAHGLACRVKFVRIVRRKLNGCNRFYVQLINEGRPYQKEENKLGKGLVGQDLGPSTVSIVSANGYADLRQFCGQLEKRQAEIKKLQRQIERQRRANNPDNYEPDRWVKSKGGKRWVHKKGQPKKGRHTWHISNRQRANERRLAELHRQQAAYRKSLHGALVNEILRQGHLFKLEKVSYIAWQKRFGRSVQFRAPGMFVKMLRRKAESAGGTVYEFPTRTTKLSQVCLCGCVQKKSLSQRWHDCSCGIHMQRDLFSAFLAICVEDDLLNAEMARELWPGLEPVLWAALSKLSAEADNPKPVNGKALPSSFGLKHLPVGQRQNRSSQKPGGIPIKSPETGSPFGFQETVE